LCEALPLNEETVELMSHKNVADETNSTPLAGAQSWKEVVARYQRPTDWRGIWQLLNTLVPQILNKT
jgi:hypothetical protein